MNKNSTLSLSAESIDNLPLNKLSDNRYARLVRVIGDVYGLFMRTLDDVV